MRLSTKHLRIAFFGEPSSNRGTVGNLARWNGRSLHSREHCTAHAQPRIQNGCMPKRVGLSTYLLRVPFYTGRWSMCYRADSGPRRRAIIIGAASALRCNFWLRILNHFWFRIVNQFWQTFPTASKKPLPVLVTNP